MARQKRIRELELDLPPELFDAEVAKLQAWACDRMFAHIKSAKVTSAVRLIVNMSYVGGYRAANRVKA